MKAGAFLLYADLDPDGLAELDAAADEEATKATLVRLLKLEADTPLRLEVVLELYLNTLRFAREQGFSIEKTSTLFSIVKRNHEEMAEAFLPPQKSWEYLKSLLLAHSVQRPPHSIGVFTLSELKLITDFALTYYYRRFKLYRYAFTLRHVKHIDLKTTFAELPPDSFPSLHDGIPFEPVKEEEAETPPPPPPAPPVELPPIELHADVSDAVRAAVEEQIAAQVTAVRAQLEAQYAERTLAHEEQIKRLEASVGVKA